jgi:hypothetical protein
LRGRPLFAAEKRRAQNPRRNGRSVFIDGYIRGHDRNVVYRPEDILPGAARPSLQRLDEGYAATLI